MLTMQEREAIFRINSGLYLQKDLETCQRQIKTLENIVNMAREHLELCSDSSQNLSRATFEIIKDYDVLSKAIKKWKK